jgi:hypothetical protein
MRLQSRQLHGILGAPIKFRVSLLPSETVDFLNRHPLDARFGQGVFDFVQLKRFHDRFDHFHKAPLSLLAKVDPRLA